VCTPHRQASRPRRCRGEGLAGAFAVAQDTTIPSDADGTSGPIILSSFRSLAATVPVPTCQNLDAAENLPPRARARLSRFNDERTTCVRTGTATCNRARCSSSFGTHPLQCSPSQQVLSPCRPAVKRTWSVLLVRQHSSVGREPLMMLRGLFTVQFISKPASPTLR
jgi:hypothetical protein